MVEDWNLTLMGTEPVFVPLPGFREYPEDVMVGRAADFYADMARRRTVRQFSDRPVPRKLIENCLRAASTAPSGANMQPWIGHRTSLGFRKQSVNPNCIELDHVL